MMTTHSPINARRCLGVASFVLLLTAGAGAQSTPPEPTQTWGEHRFGLTAPLPKPDGAFRLATYNIENLFDDVDDPALTGAQDDAGATKPPEHRAAAAAAIRAVDPDVLALEEIESKAALLWFRDEYLKDMGYNFVVSLDAGDDRGIENAVLSRFPLSEGQVWPDAPLDGVQPAKIGGKANPDAGKPILSRRSPLLVTVTIPHTSAAPAGTPDATTGAGAKFDYQLTLLVVHQKSGADFDFWREAEARANVGRISAMLKADANQNIVVLGDFNANPLERSIKIYTDSGLIDAFAGPRGAAPASGPNAIPKLVTHESGRTIDLVLMSPSLNKEAIAESRFVFGTPARPAGADWRNTPNADGHASDHYPVVVDIWRADRD